MSSPNDPWKCLTPPSRAANVSAQRVDPELPWDVFWAVDADRNCLLILQHDKELQHRKLPRPRGLRVEAFTPSSEPYARIIIRLIDKEQREIFYRFCLDIIAATRHTKTQEEAVEQFLVRIWRWHRLLRSGRDGKLSDEEQKGLIGELGVLDRHLIPVLGAINAVKCWTGPLGSPKDFEIGKVCIEAKARRIAAVPHVIISSEHQLDSSGINILFLHVTEVTPTVKDSSDAATVTQIAGEIRSKLEKHDLAAVEIFEERLASTGFSWMDDYSDKLWLQGQEYLFEVRDGFPRVTPMMFPAGVRNLRYSISLSECAPFRVKLENLQKEISERNHGD